MEYYHLGISRKGVRLILIIRQFTSPGQQDHLRDGNVRLKLNGTLWPERDQVVLPLSDEKLDYPLVYQDPKDKIHFDNLTQVSFLVTSQEEREKISLCRAG